MRLMQSVAATAIIGVCLAVPAAAFAQTDGYGQTPTPTTVVPPTSTTQNVGAGGVSRPPGSDSLPITGADLAGIVVLATASCAVGATIVFTSRRRRSLA